MMKQRKTSRNLGRDTYVRDHAQDIFKKTSHSMYSMEAGEVLFPQPEPLFRQNMVTVRLARGGRVTSVGYPGAFKDPVTGNIHGTYEGPIPGQMVMVGFESGNKVAPFVVNRYPYQGAGDTRSEFDYITPLTKAKIDATDVVVGHFSGSFLSFNTGIISGKLPGSASLNVMTAFDVAANTTIETESGLTTTFKSSLSGQVEIGAGVNITGSAAHTIESDLTGKVSIGAGVAITGAAAHTIESDLSGAISVGALLKFENAAHGLGELVASLITTLQAAVTIPAVVGSNLTFDPTFIALLEAEKAKFALLLE